jgi:hypothetical protein
MPIVIRLFAAAYQFPTSRWKFVGAWYRKRPALSMINSVVVDRNR